MDIARLQQWVGKTQSASDQATPHPIAALAATLDLDAAPPVANDPVPPLWHWLYFLEAHRQSELSNDGHAKRGGFLPPVALPRRMWAGGRFQFHHPLRVGETYTRTSQIVDVREKTGRSGNLVFLKVRHEIGNARGIALIEDQDLVYRANAEPGLPAPQAPSAPADSRWERVVEPSDVLLFRYSALTFNSHRIHYDRRYATETEGYPGLVVHGPLVATLLLDLAHRHMPEAELARFEFRAVSPLFDTSPFKVCGKPDGDGRTISLWAADAGGRVAMTATAATF
ncbi:MAG TPA: MaoC family dehydratase N-terminal domain-containing protein [Candidatus Cybelea sp.]|jgi:3-methylfumaryl-CoA hydratase|nr:MaoC family dehydratase N-terminal domain-containing protein [Candidatus Cybelea sp.]